MSQSQTTWQLSIFHCTTIYIITQKVILHLQFRLTCRNVFPTLFRSLLAAVTETFDTNFSETNDATKEDSYMSTNVDFILYTSQDS